ncbi:MAG: hypothetical protein LBP22_07145 [Deltaproteobacteria bacterium]|jgi:hypothetical protein|nr:hypothetical protein [Deltaproteobacteria bacterium]
MWDSDDLRLEKVNFVLLHIGRTTSEMKSISPMCFLIVGDINFGVNKDKDSKKMNSIPDLPKFKSKRNVKYIIFAMNPAEALK